MSALPPKADIIPHCIKCLLCANSGPISTPPTKDRVLVFVRSCVDIPQFDFNKKDPRKLMRNYRRELAIELLLSWARWLRQEAFLRKKPEPE